MIENKMEIYLIVGPIEKGDQASKMNKTNQQGSTCEL